MSMASVLHITSLPDLERARTWRLRAEEMRTAADDMISADNQATARRLADDYDRMAERTERLQLQNDGKLNGAT